LKDVVKEKLIEFPLTETADLRSRFNGLRPLLLDSSDRGPSVPVWSQLGKVSYRGDFNLMR
jgi:hypothetical protein